MNEEIDVFSIIDEPISKTRHLNHILRKIVGFRKIGKTIEPFEMEREVVVGPSGGQILPFFKDKKGKWKVVLIGQYRPAIKKRIIEGAGGEIGGESPWAALSRELKEETHIKIEPRFVSIVLNEYIHPPMLSSNVFGGIVEIRAKMVKNKIFGGKMSENEYTKVEIFDLKELLQKRDDLVIKIDLLTSRLLDEVAKVTGLLIKKY